MAVRVFPAAVPYPRAYELVERATDAVVDVYEGTYEEAKRRWQLYLRTGGYYIRRRWGF